MRRFLIRHLWRWHRRMGILASCVVLLLSVTGFLLNHADEWGWDKQLLTSKWLLKSYGVTAPTDFLGSQLFDVWWVLANEQLFMGNQAGARDIARCESDWKSVIASSDLVIAACKEKLSLFMPDGQLVEDLKTMPAGNIQGLSLLSSNTVLLYYRNSVFSVDLMSLDVEPWQGDDAALAATMIAVPESIALLIADQYTVQGLTWERFIQDLHAGRWFGGWGWVLVDLTALFLVTLSFSGVLLYTLHKRR